MWCPLRGPRLCSLGTGLEQRVSHEPQERTLITMTDTAAQLGRLMKVTEAVVAELERQGVAEALANLGFDPIEMAKAVIKAADGDVVPFKRAPT